MVEESRLEPTEHGLAPSDDGWFVLNARDTRWRPAEGRGAYCIFEGEAEFPQVGIHVVALVPGEPTSMYWGGYTVDEAALRRGAGVAHDTTDADQAYARFPSARRRGTATAGFPTSRRRYSVMRNATWYFVTDERLPGVSPAGIALSASSPRL
jgi:hypothetical protein